MGVVHFVKNLLFDVDVVMTYENLLFELNDDPLQVLYNHDDDDNIWDLICTPGYQKNFTGGHSSLAEKFLGCT